MGTSSKNRISSLAKDLGVKGKDVLALFPLKADIKPAVTTLNDSEVDFVLDAFSKQCLIDDIVKYMDGEIKLKSAETSAAPVKAESEKDKAQELKGEEKAEEKVEVKSEKPAEKKAEEKIEIKAKPEIKAEPQKKQAAKNEEPKKEIKKEAERPRYVPETAKKPQEKTQPKKQRQVGQKLELNINNSSFGMSSSVKKNVKVVDTRGGDVDLSKYDDKLYDMAPEHDRDTGKQKFNKKNNVKSGFDRKRAERAKAEAKKRQAPEKPKPPQNITLPDEMIVSELARELRITTAEVVKKLMQLGMIVTLNQVIDFETAAIVADEFGTKAERQVVVTIEEKLINDSEDTKEDLVERSPVVVVMGHVDHGKTSLLDAIRHAHVTAGEAGGITQHIGAYRVNAAGRDITFLDTPGHEAFTSMRARGAQATDIAILVVAADDGIMPQTVEAINHAKAAGVSIVVAINKMDKQGANPDVVMQELTKYDLVPEEWGGDVICVPVSALTGMGIDKLLESVILLADLAELKANPNREAKGLVIEAKLDKGRGPVATVLVQNGTLHHGDYVIAGTAVGRVRAMSDENGKILKEAGPSVPVEILGLTEVPGAGDVFNAVKDERMARELAEERKTTQKESVFQANAKVSLDDLFNQIKEGAKELAIIVKADVQGSAEAVKTSLEKLSNEEVHVRVIHSAVGGINESDVMLATASNAIIVGFNVRPDKGAIDSAERQQVDIRTYRIIYECIEEITAAMKGMLAPKFKEVILGRAEVRQTIRVPGVGVIAGSYILDGKVTRNSNIRVVRDGIVIFEDKISSLKRFKDDAREVAQGFECGIGLEKFNDIKELDIFEAFVMEEIKD